MNLQGGVPLPVIILLAVAIVGHFLTQKHDVRNVTSTRSAATPTPARAVGQSTRSATSSARSRLLGALVGIIASLLHTGRVGSASPDAGTFDGSSTPIAALRHRRHEPEWGGAAGKGGGCTARRAWVMASLDNGMSLLSVEERDAVTSSRGWCSSPPSASTWRDGAPSVILRPRRRRRTRRFRRSGFQVTGPSPSTRLRMTPALTPAWPLRSRAVTSASGTLSTITALRVAADHVLRRAT